MHALCVHTCSVCLYVLYSFPSFLFLLSSAYSTIAFSSMIISTGFVLLASFSFCSCALIFSFSFILLLLLLFLVCVNFSFYRAWEFFFPLSNYSFVRTIFVRVPSEWAKKSIDTAYIMRTLLLVKFLIPFASFRAHITVQYCVVVSILIRLITTKLCYILMNDVHCMHIACVCVFRSSCYEFVLGSKILYNCYCQA